MEIVIVFIHLCSINHILCYYNQKFIISIMKKAQKRRNGGQESLHGETWSGSGTNGARELREK